MTNGRALLAILAFAACGAPRPAARNPTNDRWRALSWEQRHDVMTFSVLPNMAHAFQRFAGTADPELTCRTCHGHDAEAVEYKMPRDLPPLDPRHLPDATNRDPRIARTAKFMIDEVTPGMADLLGVDRATFTCFACHPEAR